MRSRDLDERSIAESTADTILPSYDEYASQSSPRYIDAVDPVSIPARAGLEKAVEHRNQRTFKKKISKATALPAGGRRLPPEHLSRRPSQLPPPSSSSPHLDRGISSSSLPRPRHGSRSSTQVHADYGYHRFHGVKDARMHAKPELDELGNPIRDQVTGKLIAGVAIGVVAVAACNIM